MRFPESSRRDELSIRAWLRPRLFYFRRPMADSKKNNQRLKPQASARTRAARVNWCPDTNHSTNSHEVSNGLTADSSPSTSLRAPRFAPSAKSARNDRVRVQAFIAFSNLSIRAWLRPRLFFELQETYGRFKEGQPAAKAAGISTYESGTSELVP